MNLRKMYFRIPLQGENMLPIVVTVPESLSASYEQGNVQAITEVQGRARASALDICNKAIVLNPIEYVALVNQFPPRLELRPHKSKPKWFYVLLDDEGKGWMQEDEGGMWEVQIWLHCNKHTSAKRFGSYKSAVGFVERYFGVSEVSEFSEIEA